MAASLLDIECRIAVLRESMQRLLEDEAADAESEVLLEEQLIHQNNELEILASERDAIKRADRDADEQPADGGPEASEENPMTPAAGASARFVNYLRRR